jgi:SAM-dependent methyltransferase
LPISIPIYSLVTLFMENTAPHTVIEAFLNSIQDQSFIKCSLGGYKGKTAGLKNAYAKLAIIKKQVQLSVVYRYATKDITQNYTVESIPQFLQDNLNEHNFCAATLFTSTANKVLQYHNHKWQLRTEKATANAPQQLQHDKVKQRKITSTAKPYLHLLNLTDAEGKVYKAAQDKYKQINHYIDILHRLLLDLPPTDNLKVVDMGSGKGYLTFALYDYINNQLQKPASITGVEFRKDMVDLCNDIAQASQFQHLNFVEGTIQNYMPQQAIDILIALHACDTATDDAIQKGIIHNAALIVVAPCCHKQIRREMENTKRPEALDFLLKHGIFMERQAEMVTDGMRALILEYFGYTTKVFQFISDAHTPKNVMIVAEKRKHFTTAQQQQAFEKLQNSKTYFGIQQHYLESILTIDKPA